MQADVLAELCAVMRGVPAGTPGTPGTSRFVPGQKRPLFQLFRPFRVERDPGQKAQFGPGTRARTSSDAFDLAERAAIAIELGLVPPCYADAWADFQIHKPGHTTDRGWRQAVNDAGRLLDEWAVLAFDFGWRASDIFDLHGLAWFCAGERIRALGPDNAVTASGRIFTRRLSGSRIERQ